MLEQRNLTRPEVWVQITFWFFHIAHVRFVGENNGCISTNPRRVGIYSYYTWAHIYTNTLPQSELPVQRCSRLDNKKANTPPAVWTTGAVVFKTGQQESEHPPQSEQPAQRCSRLDKKKVQRANTYPQPQLATGYVEAGAKLREGRGGQPLGEDVSKLGGSRDMEYPNIADGDSVAHEV